jgi:hypothetical protein
VTNGSPINNPSALSGVLTGVSFLGGLAIGLSLADAPFPQPGADVKAIQKFFQASSGAGRINVAGQLLSAASWPYFRDRSRNWPVAADPRCSRPPSPGEHSPAPRWPPPRQPPPHSHRNAVVTTIRPGHYIAFCSLREGRCTAMAWRCCSAHLDWPACGALPRPLAIAALAAAAVDALAPLVLALPRAALVIPAGRFPSFVIMGIAGYRLARGPKR